MPVEIISRHETEGHLSAYVRLSDGRLLQRQWFGNDVPADLQQHLDEWEATYPADEVAAEPPAEGFAYEVRTMPDGAEIVVTWAEEPANLAAELDESGVALRDVAAALGGGE